MNISSIVPACEIAPSVRTLKIEAGGDAWKGTIKPKIRLMGRWLERAGFKPETRVTVRCIAPGIIELRSGELPVDECSPF
jgi:hypothetical protein